ncbi:MAG: glycoside hydrolase family 2 TIM barrel-domain containing protein [Acidobacteriaceae bacterium]|jgi:beta-galactosidase
MSRELTRRDFLGDAALVGVASAIGIENALASQTTPAAAPPRERRLSFDDGWSFSKGEIVDAQLLQSTGGSWAPVTLPHDWSISGPFSEAEPCGGSGAYLPTGIGWYRKSFQLPRGDAGRRILLQFDGVYQCSDVWINGQHLGTRPYGFIPFLYELSPHLHFGSEPNLVAVRVDNSHQPNLRWYSGSGINRHTWLISTGQLYIEQWGTGVTTPQITAQIATVEISTRVRNTLTRPASCKLNSAVLDQSGIAVQSMETEAEIPAGSNHLFVQRIAVPQPKLWSHTTPTLYSVRQTLRHDNADADATSTPFGIRSIEFDADKGFLLNGERVKLNGACLHDDGGSVGTAVPQRIWERRLTLLKEMGCNAIRASHNPHTNEFFDLCDRMGFLVMAEAFDEWRESKQPAYGYHRYFDEWAARDLTDMIARDRNHPSIVIWSAGNEVPDQDVPRGVETLRGLMKILHDNDPTRLVTVACDQIVAEPNGALPEFLAELDVVGYNYVGRWRDRREKFYSIDRHDFPQRRFVGTENGAMPSFIPGSSATPSAFRPASNQRIEVEQLQRFTQVYDYVSGDFMWTGIDYLGEARWPSKSSRSGVIDTCGFAKDGYYFYKSIWTKSPVLHLSPHWNWAGSEGQIVPVICFTNCDTVELFLNGKSLGVEGYMFPEMGMEGRYSNFPARTRVMQTTGDLHLTWYVPYQPGTLRAVGTKDGQVIMTVEQSTTGAPAAIRLTADRTSIDTQWDDLSHVTVEIVDSQGRVVPTADNEIVFSLTGPGRILGLDNGQADSHENYQSDRRKAYAGHALALVQSNGRPGEMQLTASSSSLTSASVTITAEPLLFSGQPL